jgi:hypothetical protein
MIPNPRTPCNQSFGWNLGANAPQADERSAVRNPDKPIGLYLRKDIAAGLRSMEHNVGFWPDGDFETRLSIRPLGGLKPTCSGHAPIFRV